MENCWQNASFLPPDRLSFCFPSMSSGVGMTWFWDHSEWQTDRRNNPAKCKGGRFVVARYGAGL